MKTSGLFEGRQWSSQLEAKVVTPGYPNHVFGYSTQGGMARTVTLGAFVYLTIKGNLPTADELALFETALLFLAPITAADGPAHAGILSRLCGASSDAVVATVAVGLTQEASYALAAHDGFLGWLDGDQSAAPSEEYLALSGQAPLVRTDLEAALQARGVALSLSPHPLKEIPAILWLLHAAGIRDRASLERSWLLARLPAGAAEAMATTPKEFLQYPANLPALEYDDGEE